MSEEFDNQMNSGDVTDDDKLWAALSLALPIIALIALLMEEKKVRPFIKHAAVHGLALAVVMIVIGVIPIVQCLSLLVWFYALYLAYQAYNGEWITIPGLTDFAKGQGWL